MLPQLKCALLASSIVLVLSGCSAASKYPISASYGPQPVLPKPQSSLIPTVNIAPAAEGLKVQAYAQGLDHPRWLYVLPNGDVLVAETDAPPKPDDTKGIRILSKRQSYPFIT